MQTVRRIVPSGLSRSVVRAYEQRELRAQCLTVHPVPARVEQFMEFQFGECFEVRAHGTTYTVPRAVIVGPHTYHQGRLVFRGRVETFTIIFQPAGFNQIFGIPMRELTDHCLEVQAVIGHAVDDMQEQLAGLSSFSERVRITDEYIVRRMSRVPGGGPVDTTATRLLESDGCVRIADLANELGVSSRHLTRVFTEQVGLPPRYCARIARFQAALSRKCARPDCTWTEIAHELGYYDQMHLVHDFRQLSGMSPGQLQAELDRLAAPVRRDNHSSASDFY